MTMRTAIVYNEPLPSRYDTRGESKAVLGVLDAVAAVQKSLIELGHDVTIVPLIPPLEHAKVILTSLDVELVFNLFEGFSGSPDTEALVPETLSKAGIPFTGCPEGVIRLALDKARVKDILKAAGIPTPDFQVLNPETVHTFRLNYPCIIKPPGEDASHGITEESFVNNFISLKKQVTAISESYGFNSLVEEFLDGREFNATVLGNSRCYLLPVSEIVYSLPPDMPMILTFASKWEADSPYFQGTKVVCPAAIGISDQKQIAETVLSAYRLLGCRGYARVDMRMDTEGRINVIEVNPNPDISPDAGTVRQARAAGMDYPRFIENVIKLAVEAVEKEPYDD